MLLEALTIVTNIAPRRTSKCTEVWRREAGPCPRARRLLPAHFWPDARERAGSAITSPVPALGRLSLYVAEHGPLVALSYNRIIASRTGRGRVLMDAEKESDTIASGQLQARAGRALRTV